MSYAENPFANPATVVLIIEPGIPGEQNIYTHPENLPSLPQVGHLISVDEPERGFRYIGKVAAVVFVMQIEAEGICKTTEVEIQCNLIDRRRLP